LPRVEISNYPETVEAFGGNEQRATVFLDRYSRKDDDGNPIERDPSEMWHRVAGALGRTDGEKDAFASILEDFKFVPGGRILAGAGSESEVTFYNCYVIPVETKIRRDGRSPDPKIWNTSDPGADSREAIFDTIGLMVDIMSRGGGVGINWSVLRPKGDHLKRVNGTTSGPVSWMDVASKAVGVVEQGGSRRGAAMFMIDDWHPDVLEFIEAKRDLSKITNANVSVCVSDAFMDAVKNDDDWTFRFPDTTYFAYNSEWDGDLGGWIGKGYPVIEYADHRARNIWRKMAEAAWASGEPGVVFLDRYNKLSTAAGVERIISVNPCGEQGLGPYSVCNLGAINLSAYVVMEPTRTYFAWDDFAEDARTATRFLDRVVDTNYYFIPENEAIQKKLRRVGLGVMGLADALIKLRLRYGSEDAAEFEAGVFATLKDSAIHESIQLAVESGPAPAWKPEMVDRPYLKSWIDSQEDPKLASEQLRNHGLRNLFLLTQAPTGTTSILAGVNSGIEPYFAFSYTRKDRTGEHKVIAPVLEEIGYNGSWTADYLVTAQGVSVEEHIAMQAAAQKYIDSSVSKTINGPNDQTVEDVEKAFTLAYQTGCKGVAYFRDGSGRDQVLYNDKPQEAPKDVAPTADYVALQAALDEANHHLAELLPFTVETKRPEALRGETRKVKTAAGTAYVTVNRDDDGRPIEMFVNVGKAGSDIMELGEAIGRLASLALRKGATLGGVANQLEGIGGNGKFNKPLAHAIGSALTEINIDDTHAPRVFVGVDVANGSATTVSSKSLDSSFVVEFDPNADNVTFTRSLTGDLCPDCQSFAVAFEEGCKKCHVCGWSAC
jgi:ribonucleoside-diphosphate reductase alpha chain